VKQPFVETVFVTTTPAVCLTMLRANLCVNVTLGSLVMEIAVPVHVSSKPSLNAK